MFKWLITCVISLWRSWKLYHVRRWLLWHTFLNKSLIVFLSLRCQMWGVEWTNDFVFYLHPRTRLVWFIGEIMYLAKLEWNHLNWIHNLNFFSSFWTYLSSYPWSLKQFDNYWYQLGMWKWTLIPISNSYVQVQRNSILVLDKYV